VCGAIAIGLLNHLIFNKTVSRFRAERFGTDILLLTYITGALCMDERKIAYCGLDCNECEAYQAARDEDLEKLKAVADKWSAQFGENIYPEQVLCDGCKAGQRKSIHCKNDCKIRICCLKKAFDTCIECEDFPCGLERSILEKAPQAGDNLKGIRTNLQAVD
jgi:hypothetical protein